MEMRIKEDITYDDNSELNFLIQKSANNFWDEPLDKLEDQTTYNFHYIDQKNQIKYFTKSDCLRDIIRLAKLDITRTVTRKRYRTEGFVPEWIWEKFFGTFSEFKKQASLDHTRGQQKLNTQLAKHVSVDHYRKMGEERREYGQLYTVNRPGKWKTLIGCSDLHDIECDPFFLRVLVDVIKMIQPDVVCVAGDLFDLPEFSKYTVDPREWDAVGRIKAGLDILRQMRENSPDSQIDLIEGNHEARILRFLSDSAPAMKSLLSDLHGMTVRDLFKLDEINVNYIAQCNLYTFTDAQMKREADERNYKIYWNSLLAHHFPNGKKKGLPGFNGHHHKHIVHSLYNTRSGNYEWHQLGSGHKRVASYMDAEHWSNGFIISHVNTMNNEVRFEYIDVGMSMAIAGGKYYERLPEEYYPQLNYELSLRNKDINT